MLLSFCFSNKQKNFLFFEKIFKRKTSLISFALYYVAVYVLSFVTGLTMGWLPVALYYLRLPHGDITLTAEQGAWMASMQSFGRLFSALPAGIATDIIGRRKVTLTAGLVYLIAWFVMPFTKTFAILCSWNLLLGIGVGLVNVANHMHMSELVSAEYRGSFHAVSGFSFNFGLLFIATTGVYLSYSFVCFLNGALCLLYVLSSYWLVESPYYLFTKGNDRLAERNFRWLRSGVPSERQEAELTVIKTNMQLQRQNRAARWNVAESSLADPVNRRCVYVVLGLNFFIILTGSVAVKLNSAFIFGRTKFIEHPAKYQLVISWTQFVASFFSTFVLEKFNRRTLFISASVIDSLILTAAGVFFYLSEYRNDLFVGGGDIKTVCFVTVLLYYACYTVTLHNLVNMLRCEILPQSVKAVGSGLAVLVQSASTSLCILLFQYISDATGGYVCWNFFAFAITSVSTAVVVYFYLPEVKGKPLAEVYDSMHARMCQRR